MLRACSLTHTTHLIFSNIALFFVTIWGTMIGQHWVDNQYTVTLTTLLQRATLVATLVANSRFCQITWTIIYYMTKTVRPNSIADRGYNP